MVIRDSTSKFVLDHNFRTFTQLRELRMDLDWPNIQFLPVSLRVLCMGTVRSEDVIDLMGHLTNLKVLVVQSHSVARDQILSLREIANHKSLTFLGIDGHCCTPGCQAYQSDNAWETCGFRHGNRLAAFRAVR